jgi:hypothetical protein
MLQLLHLAPYFGAFLLNAVAIGSTENHLRKSCSAFCTKDVDEMDP